MTGWAPKVNGIEAHSVEIPIVPELTLALEGEIYVAIYVHVAGGGGSYTISNLKFIPRDIDPIVADTAPGSDAVLYKPPVKPGTAKSFDLDISDVTKFDVVYSAIGSTPVTPTFDDGAAIATFTGNGQRLNIKLSAEQTATLNSWVNNTIKVNVDAELLDDDDDEDTPITGDNFRYHIGDASFGGNWNTTSGVGASALANIIGDKTITFETSLDKENDGPVSGVKYYSNRPVNFIIQHQSGDGPTVIKINKITISVEVDSKAPDTFITSTGKQKVAVLEDDFVGFFGSAAKFEHSILTVNGSGGFWIGLPADVTASDTVTITYSAFSTDDAEIKVVRK